MAVAEDQAQYEQALQEQALQEQALPLPVQEWLTHLEKNRRYADHTITAYRRDLLALMALAEGRALETIEQQHIRQYLAISHARGQQPRSLARMLAAWRGFYAWWGPLIKLAANPAKEVRAPKIKRSLPKALSVDQMQALLDAPTLTVDASPEGKRDRAMFELFYSSGLRLSELVQLDQHYVNLPDHQSKGWIDLEQAQVHVLGKGQKPRTVPIGRHAIVALRNWLAVRASLNRQHRTPMDEAALFLGQRGARIHPRVVQQRLATLCVKAGLPTRVHPHVLRHSFASHVLQSAQDLRAVQEMLGHASISTTQIYTKLDFQHLSAVYDAAHPRANRKDRG
jgi:integrase/recombinase XerC